MRCVDWNNILDTILISYSQNVLDNYATIAVNLQREEIERMHIFCRPDGYSSPLVKISFSLKFSFHQKTYSAETQTVPEDSLNCQPLG